MTEFQEHGGKKHEKFKKSFKCNLFVRKSKWFIYYNNIIYVPYWIFETRTKIKVNSAHLTF